MSCYLHRPLTRAKRPASANWYRMTLLGDEDGAAAYPACVEVGERVGRGVERVGLGMQRNLARLGQRHQLDQVVVRADDVADDVPLGGDDVERRDGDGAAVADHEIGAARPGHVPG